MKKRGEVNANCYLVLLGFFKKHPWKVFLQVGDRKYFFWELLFVSAQYAAFLSKRSRKGDRVCVQVEKNFETICLYLACLQLGLVFVPLGEGDGLVEIKGVLKETSPALVFFQKNTEHIFSEIDHLYRISFGFSESSLSKGSRLLLPFFDVTHVNSKDDAYVLYTSGTTGFPRGVVHSHENVILYSTQLASFWKVSSRDTLLLVHTLSRNLGLSSLNLSLCSGSMLLFPVVQDFNSIVHLLQKATIFFGSPGFYKKSIIEKNIDPDSFKKIRLLVSSAMPLSESIFNDFLKKFGKSIVNRYAMTETIVITSSSNDTRFKGCGKPLPSVDVRIVDSLGVSIPLGEIGFIEVKSPYLFLGYLGHEGEKGIFRDDGYFMTGDMGKLDNQGNLWFEGRKNDVMYTRQGKVYTREIEMYLEDLEEVERAAVFGFSFLEKGERPIAYVQLRKEFESVTGVDLMVKIKQRIHSKKVPENLFVIKEMPLTSTGKIQKNILYQKYETFLKEGGFI